MHVVVVESPAKAKTVQQYLGGDYRVLASWGHVRDLPAKDGSVRPDSGFAMTYASGPRARRVLGRIRTALKGADSLILATDPDREGEAIAWQVLTWLQERDAMGERPVRRAPSADYCLRLTRPPELSSGAPVGAWHSDPSPTLVLPNGPAPRYGHVDDTQRSGPARSVAVTSPANNASPVASASTHDIAESSAVGTNVRAPVTGNDPHSDALAHTLEGTEAASLEIVSNGGQTGTKPGVTCDHDVKSGDAMTVEADHGNGGGVTNAITTIAIDVDERPSTHPAPTLVDVSNPHRRGLGDRQFRRAGKYSKGNTNDPHG